jgi:ATP-binding cassette, subfamily C, bacterial
MSLLASFYRAYPWQMLVTVVALSIAGLAEGIGVTALLPLLNVAIASDAAIAANGNVGMDSDFERSVQHAMELMGIAPTIGNLLLILVGAVAFKSATLLIAQRQVGYTAARLATDLRLELLRAILLSRWEYFLNQPVGKLTNSLATEAARAADAFVAGATGLTFVLQGSVYGIVALAVSWQATVAGALAGSIIILLTRSLVRMTRKAGRKQTSALLSLMATMTDTLMSVKPLKGMAREHLADSVLAMETARVNRALRRQVLGTALLDAMQEMLFALIIAAGMYTALVYIGMPLATVIILVIAIGRMVALLGKVQKQYQRMSLGESAYWSMKSTIAEAQREREHLHAGERPRLERELRMRNVVFAYGEKRVLDNIDLDIRVGELAVLVGGSGAGKTTVVDLLIGLLTPQSGVISIDGVPLSDMDIKQWRRCIGYVPQETLLLHESVAHNISLGDASVSRADIERALKLAEAWDFVSAMPEGLDSSVGERGGKLSGGQRQRIVIARALVQRPRLLILDEATSALDRENAAAIRDTLLHLRGELTILAITHQRDLLEVADRVYRLEGGRLESSSAAATS